MFNNVKYKVNDEMHEPIILKSSDLRSSSERVVCDEGAEQRNIPLELSNIVNYLSYYKKLSLLGKITYFPKLIKIIITNVKSLYNGQ